MTYSNPVSEDVMFTKGSYEFRRSGHVFNKRGLAYGLITYIRNPKIRVLWEAWLLA